MPFERAIEFQDRPARLNWRVSLPKKYRVFGEFGLNSAKESQIEIGKNVSYSENKTREISQVEKYSIFIVKCTVGLILCDLWEKSSE